MIREPSASIEDYRSSSSSSDSSSGYDLTGVEDYAISFQDVIDCAVVW
jgi:hypothetical protein